MSFKKDNPELYRQIQKCVCYGVTALLVLACSLILYFCIERVTGLRGFVKEIIAALMPIVWGVVIAYVLSPIYNMVHRNLYPLVQKHCSPAASKNLTKAAGIIAAFAVLLAVIITLIVLIIPRLIRSIAEIFSMIPYYIEQVRNGLTLILAGYPETQEVVVDAYNSGVTYITNWVTSHLDFQTLTETLSSDSLQDLWSSLSDVILGISNGVVSMVVFLKDFIIGIVVAVYILAGKQHMCGQIKKLIFVVLPRKFGNVVMENLRYAHHAFSGFISGKIVDSAIIGVLCFFGCTILDIPYPMLVSVIIGITNIIPFFGPFIGAIPCAIFILIVEPFKCLVFVIFILALQQFDGNILGPKILGDATGLSSFWVIFALLLFGGLFGVPGMILGVPIFSVICHIVDQIADAVLRKKGLSTDTKDYELLGHVEDGVYHKVPNPAYEWDPFTTRSKRLNDRRKKARDQRRSRGSSRPEDGTGSASEQDQPAAEQTPENPEKKSE